MEKDISVENRGEAQTKKRFFLKHKKSSALVVTIGLHAVAAVIAISCVVAQALRPAPAVFEATEIERPQPQLKKLKIPVKDNRKQAPKIHQMLVTRPNTNVSLQMPEMVGVIGGSFGNGSVLGENMPGFDFDLFGGSGYSGDELIGTFYDLKQDRKRKPTEIAEMIASIKDPYNSSIQEAACRIVRRFVSSGCDERKLKDYFKAPKLKYGTAFMMPPMAAAAAPLAFGVQDDVKPSYWVCHYKGKIAAPESGKFRFCGIGDDLLIVRVGGKIVLDACWPELIGVSTDWESDDPSSRMYSLNGYKYGKFAPSLWQNIYQQIEKKGGYDGGSLRLWGSALSQVVYPEGADRNGAYMKAASRMVIGDWVPLAKGRCVDIDIIVAEVPGGEFNCRLLIEQQGKDYPMAASDNGMRKILPVFKTKEITNAELIKKMEIDSNEMSLDGPVFGAKSNGIQ